MSKTLTVRQAQRLDRYAIHRLGIPSLVLMENAGRQISKDIVKIARNKKNFSVCIVCGTGNNGGDGLVAARYLFNERLRVRVFVIGQRRDLKQDPATNYRILKNLGCSVKFIPGVTPATLRELRHARVIVDAIFGIGLSRPVGEPFKSVIEAINQCAKIVVSADVPSGLDATTGRIFGVCIKASRTVTFVAMKKGFLKHEGPRSAGQVKVVKIGIPPKSVQHFK